MMFSTVSLRSGLAAVAAATVLVASADAAFARCTRLAFSVNDYGKDGPTKDAQSLLDKYVAKWAAERGIKNYTTGKKETSCELFLDFGVFDEHTCKAAATVCWPGDALPAPIQAAAPGADGQPVKPRAAAKPAAPKATKTAAPAAAASPITTGALPAPVTEAPATPVAAPTTAPAPVAAPAAAAAPSGPPVAPEPAVPAAKAPAKTE